MTDIVDVWAQHPTERFLAQPWLATVWRWTGQVRPRELPVELTVEAMDAAGISVSLLAGWHGPTGSLISNDEVAATIAKYPNRFAGLASVDLQGPGKVGRRR